MAKKTHVTPPWVMEQVPSQTLYAIQAVAEGRASSLQQMVAWFFIIDVLCKTDRMSFFHGGEDGRRATDFSEGKRWIGSQLRRLQKIKPEFQDLTREPPLPPELREATREQAAQEMANATPERSEQPPEATAE